MLLNQPVPVHDGGMNAIMNTEQFTTFEQIRDFLSGTREGAFPMPTKSSRYADLT